MNPYSFSYIVFIEYITRNTSLNPLLRVQFLIAMDSNSVNIAAS